jgi:hypothetical protein
MERGRTGLVGQWVVLGADFAGRTVGTVFGTLQDVRSEIGARIGATIDWVDASQQGGLRLVRTIHGRIDGIAKDALETGELALTDLVRSVRTTSEEATRFASRAARVLVDAPPTAN